MVEYFDERCIEFIKDSNEEPNIGMNCALLKQVQLFITGLNGLTDVRLSKIYYVLGIPFPDNYLLDYKLKKNQPAFEFEYDEKLGKIRMNIDVPDQPVLRYLGDDFAFEYTFTLRKED